MKDVMQTNAYFSNYRAVSTHKTSSSKPTLGIIHERVCIQNLIQISTDKQVRIQMQRDTGFDLWTQDDAERYWFQLVDLGPTLFAFFISHISYLIFLSIRIQMVYIIYSYFVVQILDMYLPYCCSIDQEDGVQR